MKNKTFEVTVLNWIKAIDRRPTPSPYIVWRLMDKTDAGIGYSSRGFMANSGRRVSPKKFDIEWLDEYYPYVDSSPKYYGTIKNFSVRLPVLTPFMKINIGRLEVNCFDEDSNMSFRVGNSRLQDLTVDEVKELIRFMLSHIENRKP